MLKTTIFLSKEHSFEKKIQLANQLTLIDQACFEDRAYDAGDFMSFMGFPSFVAILLWDDDQLVGSTIAGSAQQVYGSFSNYFHRFDNTDETVAYILNTAIHPDYQGKGYVVLLMDTLKKWLIDQGYQLLDRDSSVNGSPKGSYAKKIQDHEANLIVFARPPVDTVYGPQQYIRMKLFA